jgi:hypothetical protein
MAKNKQRKNSWRTQMLRGMKRKKIFIPLTILLIVLGIWFVQYVRIEISAHDDRQLLESVEVQMTKDFNEVLAQIDKKPSSIKRDKNCTYPNTLGDPGPSNCGTALEVAIIGPGNYDSVVKYLGSQFSLAEKSQYPTGQGKTKYWVINRYGVQCSIQLDQISSPDSINLYFRCGKSTKKEIYKVYDYNL